MEEYVEPLVSVIIPTYNRAAFIKESVNSVLSQSYRMLECIVVDDCSEDETEDILKSIKEPRVRYIKNAARMGAAGARNLGITQALGEIVAFNDSDDIWNERKLEYQIEFMRRHQEYDMVFCAYTLLDKKKEIRFPGKSQEGCQLAGYIYERLLIENFIGTPTIVIKKECLKKIGMFDTSLKALEDYDLVLRVAQCSLIGYVNQELVQAHRVDFSISSDMESHIKALFRIIQKNRIYAGKRIAVLEQLTLNEIFSLTDIRKQENFFSYMQEHILSIDECFCLLFQSAKRNQILSSRQNVLFFMLELEEPHKFWRKLLRETGAKNLAIYGAGKVGKILAKQIQESGIEVNCLIDKKNMQVPNITAVCVENIPLEVDLIICSIDESLYSKGELQSYTSAQIINIREIVKNHCIS